MNKRTLLIIGLFAICLCSCANVTENSPMNPTLEISSENMPTQEVISETIGDTESHTAEEQVVEQYSLTLDVLRDLIISESLTTTDFKKYSNGVIDSSDNASMNYYINFPIPLDDDVITLKVALLKEDDSLNLIYLFRESNAEMLMLPDCTIEKVDAFISHKYDISADITFTLPEGLTLEAYNDNIGYGGGCLLTPYVYEGSDFTPEDWKAAGFIGRFRADEHMIEWNGEEIAQIYTYSNHSIMEGIGSTKECFWPGFIVKGNHDLYTARELGDLEESGVNLADIETTSDYWYVFMAKPDEEFGYVVSLNAKNYTMEDTLEFAKSVSKIPHAGKQ